MNAVNDAPVAVDDYASTSEGMAIVITVSDDTVPNDVLDNDTDMDANTTLTVTEVGGCEQRHRRPCR